MNYKIKKLLRKESADLMLDVKEKVKAKISFAPKKERISTKKKISSRRNYLFGGFGFAAVCLVLLIAMPFLMTPNGNQNSETVVAFDSTPKFAMKLDSNDFVINVQPLNVDGIFLVNEIRPLILNQPLQTAIEISLTELDEQGYLVEDNIFKCIASCKDTDKESQLNLQLASSILDFQTQKAERINFSGTYDVGKKPQADRYSVSVGFFTLAEDLANKTNTPMSKIIRKDINSIMKELYEVDVPKLEKLDNKVEECFGEIKNQFENKKTEYNEKAEVVSKDTKLLLQMLEEEKDITKEMIKFKADHSDYLFEGKNHNEALKIYLVKKDAAIDRQLELLESKFKEEKQSIHNIIKDKEDTQTEIDYANDFNFVDFDVIDNLGNVKAEDFEDIY